MTDPGQLSLGFLTVLKDDSGTLFGGLLLVNGYSRPLEFHCTTPVRVSKTQQIFFGRTLEPYLYGEQIAAALLRKVGVSPNLVLTDKRPVLAARLVVDYPLLWLVERTQATPENQPHENPPLAQSQINGTASPATGARSISSAKNTLQCFVHQGWKFATYASGEKLAQLQETLQALPDDFDLREPFERIVQAIDEAKRSVAVH